MLETLKDLGETQALGAIGADSHFILSNLKRP
jgi:hypothetical protein